MTKDEFKAILFMAAWVAAMVVCEVLVNHGYETAAKWVWWFDMTVQGLIFYNAVRLDKKEQELKKARRLFKKQSENYIEYITRK